MSKERGKVTYLVYHRRSFYTRNRRNCCTKLMFRAIEKGFEPIIKLLIKQGGLRINARLAASGETFLHFATRILQHQYCKYCMAVIRRLVRAGCRINSANSKGETALHTALRYHKLDLAAEMIKLGANVCAKNNEGETPLLLTVANNCNAYKGETIYREELRGLVKMLLDAGADVNARDRNDRLPIHYAISTGDLELVKTFIEAGADLNNWHRDGFAVLHNAVLTGNEAMVDLLLSRGAKVDIEHALYGDTPLHWAIYYKAIGKIQEGIIRRLMEFGSDMYHENVRAKTPLHYVLLFGDVDLLTLFVDEYKADLDNMRGNNALAFAALNQDERVMDLVLQRGAGLEVDQRCKVTCQTPLHRASAQSYLGNVRQLISRGADVNAKDKEGRTPLQHCILHPYDSSEMQLRVNFTEEKKRLIRLLLDSGSDVNYFFYSPESYEQTAIEIAVALKDIEAWKLLIEYAAEFEARTNQPLFDERNMGVIERNPELESYYQECRAELATMRMTKIEGSFVSYLSVLTQRLDVVAGYARNEELVKNLQLFTIQAGVYPIYACQLKEKFDEAIARRKTIEQVTTVLSEMLHQFVDLADSILENIFKHLNEHDIKVLIGST